ncbi:MAG: hypothetical protein ACKOD2_16450 [Ilumatobacteraceae bacterium]
MTIAVAVPVLAGTGSSAKASDPSLRLVSAPTSVEPGAPLEIELRSVGAASPPMQVQVTVSRLGDGATDLAAELATPPSDVIDAVLLDRSSMKVSAETIQFSVETELNPVASDRLAFPSSGIYAVTISAGTIGSVTIPVLRLSPSGDVPVAVAMVMEVDSPLSLRPDGTSEITDEVRGDIARLRSFLAAANAPVSVAVRPELLDSLANSPSSADRELVASLGEAFGRQRLLSEPYLHLDPSVATNSGAESDFTAQFRLGEDTLSRLLRRLPDRRVWVATDPLSPAGATFVRNLGASLIIQAAGPARARDTTRQGTSQSQRAQNVLVPTDIDDALAQASDDPVRTAHVILVDLLRVAVGGPQSTVVLMPDVRTANADVLVALATLLGTDQAIQAVDIEGAGTGKAQVITEDAPEVADFSTARERRVKLQDLVAATSAIVPDGDDRPARWGIRADVLLDTRLADDERAAYETQLRADLLSVQGALVLQVPSAVNLGDRTSTIPVTIENVGEVPLQVAVRLSSGKLRSTPTSDVITVEPGAASFVRIPVSARSNGRFPVRVQLLAPGTKSTIGTAQTINVRVGTFSGLGLVLSFAFVAALLSWWAQHLRRRWRREATAEIERRRLAGLPFDEYDDFVDSDEVDGRRTDG